MSVKLVHVAAAVIHDDSGRVLLAQRPGGKPYAGYWEFPGGKLEPGESARDALTRELREELGIDVRNAAPWLLQRFTYPHADVLLHFFRVFAFDGTPAGHDGQAFEWQTPGHFTCAPLLPANTRVLRALELPAVYGITMASEQGEAAFLDRARVAFLRGLRLLVVREKDWDDEQQRALARALLEVARPFGAKVLLNGPAELARETGCDGVHWTAAMLAAAKARPEGMLCAASCHTADELARAGGLGLDFVVLGPVRATPTHPNVHPLGWKAFAQIAANATLPVFALGGLSHADRDIAIAHGAHGIALRRGAWDLL